MNLWQTYSRKIVDLDSPKIEDICIGDIARSLSLQCRFNGHVSSFYSVAEHSVRCSWLARELYSGTVDYFAYIRRWCLMHDAAEAYIGDLTRPVKQKINGRFAKLEMLFEHLVAEAFDLALPYPEEVKEIDDTLVITEARDIMPGGPAWDWGYKIAPLLECIIPWSPGVAEETFLQEYKDLWR